MNKGRLGGLIVFTCNHDRCLSEYDSREEDPDIAVELLKNAGWAQVETNAPSKWDHFCPEHRAQILKGADGNMDQKPEAYATYGGNGDASPPEEDFNCIRTTVAPDRDVLIVQVWLKGKPGSWIEYGPAGLDNLIELLQRGRAELREPAKGDAS